MSLPVATLHRHASRVRLADGATGTLPADGSATAVEFAATAHAADFLRFWKTDPRGMTVLRDALSRSRPGSLNRFSDDDVIDQLADQLAAGELVAFVEAPIFQPGPEAVAAEASAAAAAGAAAAAAAVVSPGDTPAAPLLPLLEEVRIEGAEVLPEVMQTLEQLELTMEEISLANLSLDPAPSGLPPIETELGGASGSISESLDEL